MKEVEHRIDVSSLTSCDLVDPLLARILKGCKSTLLPTLTSIVNLSLQSACMLLCEQRLHFRSMKWRAKGSFSLAVSYRENVASAHRVRVCLDS